MANQAQLLSSAVCSGRATSALPSLFCLDGSDSPTRKCSNFICSFYKRSLQHSSNLAAWFIRKGVAFGHLSFAFPFLKSLRLQKTRNQFCSVLCYGSLEAEKQNLAYVVKAETGTSFSRKWNYQNTKGIAAFQRLVRTHYILNLGRFGLQISECRVYRKLSK